jgi:TrmH family RNA methyltransferase
LADGPKSVASALAVPHCVQEVFATAAASAAYAELAAEAGERWTLVEDSALDLLSDSVTPAGIVAVCRFLDRPLAATLDSAKLVGICADVRDPGNAGTVVRTCDAAGADAVVFAGNSVDPYNSKTVRASVGSLFHMPLTVGVTPEQAIASAHDNGLTVLAADGAGELDLDQAGEALRGPTAWVFGNEAWGLPAEVASLADFRVRIPIYGGAESLNLATAAALCLYASARAHRRPVAR